MSSDRFSRRTNWRLQPNRFTEAQREVFAAGREVLDLTLSNPTRAGLAYESDAILKALCDPAALDYDPQPKGMLAARSAIAEYYRERSRPARVDPETVVLTTSTSEGYSYIMRLLVNPGEEILVPQPSYPLFEFLADIQDVTPASYPLIYDHGWTIDFPSLESAVNERTRAVVVVHPNNPTGSYVSSPEQSRLNQFCRARGLALIVDEVFLDYSHDGTVRPSFVSNQEVLTFTVSGLSKISALPQMKVAWIVTSGPRDAVMSAMGRLEIVADTYLSMNTPLQLAIPVLLEQRNAIQLQLQERVRTNRCELDRQLAVRSSSRRLDVEGGWYAVLRVPVTRSDEELAIELLQNKSVLVHPGHFYDFVQEGYLVLSLIAPPEKFREGSRRIIEFLV